MAFTISPGRWGKTTPTIGSRGGNSSRMGACDEIQTKKTVATAGRSYGGPSEKFVGVLPCWGESAGVALELLRIAFMLGVLLP